ncbi:putative ribonuclease H-like domain-containing protein [Tanacetum coccineum]
MARGPLEPNGSLETRKDATGDCKGETRQDWLHKINSSSDKVYKVEKALYGLHQAPRAWYETLSTYLIENGFRRGTIDKTLFIKKDKGDILLVQVYVDDIIFGSTKKSLCDEFEGLQVQQKKDGIFISQDKYVADILKKFDFATVKTASTPMEPNKALIKDEEADSVDVHLYRSMIGSLMYLTASRPDIMFAVLLVQVTKFTPKMSHLHAVKRIFRYLKGQPKLGLWYPRDSPFDLEAFSDSDYAGASLDRKSTTGVEYVAAANCCGQNPVFHSKTKHIEIRHHFIRDSYEKKLIQVIKIHTDQIVADLLTKAFDVSRLILVYINAAKHKVSTAGILNAAKLTLMLLSYCSLGYLMLLGIPWVSFDSLFVEEAKKTTEVPHPSDSTADDPLLSGEDRLKLTDLMDMCTKLSERILDLEHTKTAQAQEITNLKLRVKKLEKKTGLRTHKFKRLYKVGVTRRVEYSDDESLDAQEDAFNQGRSIEDIDKDAEVSLVDETQGRSDDAEMFDTDSLIGNKVFAENNIIEKDQDVIPKEFSIAAPSTTAVSPPIITEVEIILAQTLAKLKSAKSKVVIQEPVQSTATAAPSTIPKAKGITFRDAGESTIRTPTSVYSSSIKDKGKAKIDEPEVPLKKKDQIALDEEMARNLEAQIQAELIEEERLARKKEKEANIALIESWDNTQAMMEADF